MKLRITGLIKAAVVYSLASLYFKAVASPYSAEKVSAENGVGAFV